MPTTKEINEALLKNVPYQNNNTYANGWDAGVRDVSSGNHDRILKNPDMWDDPPNYIGGFYYNLEDDDYYGEIDNRWYEGWNEGKEAALAMKEGIPVKEKSQEEIMYDRRMKCFTMAEKYAPRAAIQGGDREPVGETINRAEALMGYFYKGTLPGEPVVEGKAKK